MPPEAANQPCATEPIGDHVLPAHRLDGLAEGARFVSRVADQAFVACVCLVAAAIVIVAALIGIAH